MNRVAVIQMVSTPDIKTNLRAAELLIQDAVNQKAKLIVLPENFAFMDYDEMSRLKVAEDFKKGPLQDFSSQQAKHHNIWLLGGTIPFKSKDPQRIRSVSLLYNSKGECAARYDKIHLFDVSVADTKQTYQESKSTEPGSEIVTAQTPYGKLGLSVCYDLRFPELYREQSNQGAQIFTIPSAFTAVTGKAHWETLLRARAIENLAFVLAPGQGGLHENARETWGHSMIIDPWGRVLAELDFGSGVIVADLDMNEQYEIRKRFPVLEHRRV